MIAEWVLEFSGKDSSTEKHIAWSGTISAMKKGTRGSFILFRNNRSELKFKKFLSVKILHSQMKAGPNLALTRWFSNSNGIGLILDQVYLQFHSSTKNGYEIMVLLVKRKNSAKKKKYCSSGVLNCSVLPAPALREGLKKK